MSFFKYLVLIFASIISVEAFAAPVYKSNDYPSVTGGSLAEVCSNIKTYVSRPNRIYTSSSTNTDSETETTFTCFFDAKTADGQNLGAYQFSGLIKPSVCPTKGYPADFHMGANGEIPIRGCLKMPNGSTCSFSAQGKEPFWVVLSGGQTKTRQLYSDSDEASPSCTPLNEGQCDSKNPYGSCYQPPNDGCIRNKDGSINCPSNQPPPIKQGCENGATYCERPPGGCGPDFVSGSFNGKQICVRKGPENDPNKPVKPNDPNEPNDPNKCTSSYCPKPDPKRDCPTGYYETKHEGQTICVVNNPTPNQPNPNDPNNTDDPPKPVDPINPNLPFDSSSIINAIKSLRDSLLGAIDGVSKKLTDLTNGQKTTNEKLDKTNESLKKIGDSMGATSEVLANIEDATQAASEGIGESNKKLDGLKDAVEGSHKCKNESYNPSDKNSPKYRECTESDLPPSEGSLNIDNISIPESDENYVTWSAACPPDVSIPINLMGQSSSLVLSWSPWCELLSKIRWAIIACAYFAAAYIILGMR